MDGLLAKYIALATHGTVWLRDRSGEAPELQAVNTALADVDDVSFGDIQGTARWLTGLAQSGVPRIWLSIHPALRYSVGRPHEPRWYQDVAFAEGINGCTGLMVRDHQIWHASLGTGMRTAAGARTRTLAFTSETSLAKPESHPMSTAVDRLEHRLDRAAAFARDHGFAPWDAILARARAVGSAQSLPTLPYGDLFPDYGFTPGSQRLAAMAQAAWVFGGAGSWNDWKTIDEAANIEYRWVTRDLFAAVMAAFESAVNSKLTRIRR